MRKSLLGGLLAIAVVCCLLVGQAFAASTASFGRAGVGGTWMAGPGCGGQHEWFQHPDSFPYFCDGAASVEKAHWQSWGGGKARGTATMNEAVLNSHNNVGTAPRQLSAVTLIASHRERCGPRHVYKSVVIRFDHPRQGAPKILKLGSYIVCPGSR
jgi:hypothetical protein